MPDLASPSAPAAGRSQEPAPSPGLARRAWPALLLLAAGLLATALATRQTQMVVAAAARQEFDFASQQISLKVAERLQAHEQILRSGAALFAAVGTVSRAEWHAFVQSLQVEQRLPGIQGVGYSLLIPSERLAQHQVAIRQEGFPSYRVWPEGERAVYSAIIYLEPFTNRNLRAFGYDMLSEPVRRTAMERARDENAAALSGKVLLVQETATDVQPGTLMYVPVYRRERPVATVAERRAALQGWVYSPYRMSDLMRGILGGWDSPTTKRIRLQVFDGEELSPDGLLYDTQAADKPSRRPASGLTLQAPITFAGHDWTLLFTQGSTPASVAAYGRVWGVAGGGTALSLLLAGLLHSLRNTRFNARRLAGQLTADLQHTTDRLALATAAGGVGIWDYDVVNNHLVWDDQMFRLYGITRIQFSGAYEAWTAGVHPDDRQRGDEEIQQALRGEKEFNTEFRVLWRDGSIRHLQAQARVQRDAAGQPVRMLGTNWDITARKQAEVALRESEENIHLLLDSTAEAIYGIDLNGDCTFCNTSCLRLLGYQDPGDLLGQNMHWKIHGKHADGSCFAVEECRIFQAFVKGEPSHVDDEVIWRADGTSFPAEYWSYPQRRHGRVVGAVVTFLDITESKRAVEELRSKTALLSGLLNSIPDLVFYKSSQGVYLGCNPPFARFVNRPVPEIIGRTDSDLFGGEVAAEFRENDRLMIEHNEARHNEEWIQYVDGRRVLVETIKAPLRDAEDKVVGLLGMSRDITERKRAEEELRSKTALLEAQADATLDGILVIDPHGKRLLTNKRIQELLQVPEAVLADADDDALLKHVVSLTKYPGPFLEKVRHLYDHPDETSRDEIEFANGMVLDRYSAPVLGQDGQSHGRIWSFRNITESKRAEAELLRTLAAEREFSALQGSFVNMVSHEFRTPLAAILGAAELLDDYYDRLAPEKRADYFQLIRQEIQRLSAMLQDVLLQGQLDAGRVQFKPRPTDVIALCQEIVRRAQTIFSKHPPIQFEGEAPGRQTLVDEDLFERALSNLLTNALKYSPELTPVRLTVRQVGEEWELQVQDQGIGIPAADQATLFSAFHRGGNVGSIKGTGVGLYIVKKCAELHGGRVELHSEAGHGSTFTLHLPARPVAPPPAEAT